MCLLCLLLSKEEGSSPVSLQTDFLETRPIIFGSHFSINIGFIKNTIGITNLFVLFILDIYLYTTSAITGTDGLLTNIKVTSHLEEYYSYYFS